jgi:hypothetical protein
MQVLVNSCGHPNANALPFECLIWRKYSKVRGRKKSAHEPGAVTPPKVPRDFDPLSPRQGGDVEKIRGRDSKRFKFDAMPP